MSLRYLLGHAEIFIGARKLRNVLVHEYMSDAGLFLQALLTADEAAEMLFTAVVPSKKKREPSVCFRGFKYEVHRLKNGWAKSQ